MKKNWLPLLIPVFLPLLAPVLPAQTSSDAILMQPREVCLAVIYDHSAFDQYWEGSRLRKNGTIATVSRNSGITMLALGIFGKLNFIAGLPYVQTKSSEPNGGKFAGAKGLQDLSLALKYQVFEKQIGEGRLALLSTLGFSTPVSNYLSDYRPYSLGFGATEFSLRGIVQYQLNNGFYARSALAYLRRGQTEAERNYYYNNGSYYTPWMDVPNAWQYQAVLGKWMLDNSLKLEANFTGLHSVSGDDIRPYNAPQPTNKVEEQLLGASAQYYLKKPKGLGALAYYSQVIHGRNTGKSGNFGVGITYQFKF